MFKDAETERAYMRDYYERNRAQIAARRKAHREAHPELYKDRAHKYRAENLDALKFKDKEYREAHTRTRVRSDRDREGQRKHQMKEEYKIKARERRRAPLRRMRDTIIQGYGGKCACCGESERVFLAIDHVNNDGHKHRKEKVFGESFYRWIIKENFPPTLQLLCHNCNMAKALLGQCPHVTKRALRVA